MSDFVLTCESAADRTREFFESRNIPVVCFHYEIDDVVYTDDLYPVSYTHLTLPTILRV